MTTFIAFLINEVKTMNVKVRDWLSLTTEEKQTALNEKAGVSNEI